MREANPGDSIKHVIPAIPIQESEAWMLCDKEMLKGLLETDLSFQELELTYQVGRIERDWRS